MPELPEVETTRQKLLPLVLERTIARVDMSGFERLFLTRPRRIREQLVGRRVQAVERRGKYLIFVLDHGWRLCVHLGMTGQLVSSRAHRTDRHVQLRLRFADGGPALLFRDPRRFGKVLLLAPGETSPRLEQLGPDALTIGLAEFRRRLGARRAAIKAVLLDQKLLAGVGNIYADEALFRAALRPTRPACRLGPSDSARLLRSIRFVLRRAIEHGGTTLSDFTHPDGKRGGYLPRCQVYGRTDEPCLRCGQPIVRTLVAQRSAHFCPRCQR